MGSRIYDRNMDFLKKKVSGIYDVVLDGQAIYDDKITKIGSCTNNCILEYQNTKCYVHSVYNIEREMSKMISGIDIDCETLIFLGFGYGHILSYITKNFKNIKNVIIIEPSLNLFKEVIHNVEINFLGKLNVTLYLNITPEIVVSILTQFFTTSNKAMIISHIYFILAYKEYYEKISKPLLKFLNNFVVEVSTVRHHIYDWMGNVVRNFKHDVIPFEAIYEDLKGLPIIIVSAGPSLDKNILLLKEVKDRALIIAVGSAVRILHNKGVVPHLRMALDPAPHEWDAVVEGIDTSAAPLMYVGAIFHKILDEYKAPIIRLVADIDFITKYAYKKGNIEYKPIRGGFSVSNVALNVACLLGSKKIILMGQDMCYSKERIYAEGAWTSATIDIAKSNYLKEHDIFGNEVYTMKVYLGIRTQIESVVKENSDIEFINSTEGGLKIDNIPNIDFQDALKTLDDSINVKEILNRSISNLTNVLKSSDILKSIKEIEKELDDLIKVNNDRLKQIKRLFRYKRKRIGTKKILTEYVGLNRFEKIITENELYDNVINKSLLNILLSTRIKCNYTGDDIEKQLESIETIVSGYTYEIRSYCEILKLLIEELKYQIIGEVPNKFKGVVL